MEQLAERCFWVRLYTLWTSPTHPEASTGKIANKVFKKLTRSPSSPTLHPSEQSLVPTPHLWQNTIVPSQQSIFPTENKQKNWNMVSAVVTPFSEMIDFSYSQYKVAVSQDGSKIAFGTPFVNDNIGAVTMYHYLKPNIDVASIYRSSWETTGTNH